MTTNQPDPPQYSAPVVEESAVVTTEVTTTGAVTVRSRASSDPEMVRENVERHDAEIDRVPIGREVDAIPGIRQEGDLLYIPVVEEELVITKRLILREEIIVRRIVTTQVTEIPVTLRRTEVTVERD